MAGEWRRREVSELIGDGKLVIGDGYRAKNDELASVGLPFARAGNINEGFRFDDADHFPEENLARVGNKISEPGDVVFTSKGTVGRFAFVRLETPRFVYSPQLCFWRSLDKEEIEPRFLYYWMFGREFFVQFKGVAGQTDMAEYVSLADQRRMHIALPPPPEQRAIAHILGMLDDKIELNRRMNETLEGIARAIFKSWFVDLDPVRAKAESRPGGTGLPKPLADLFPDAFEESELGKVPSGWEVGRWGDLVTLEYGKSLTDYANGKGIYPVFGTNGKIGSHSEALCDHPGIIIGRKGAYRGVHFCNSPFFVIDTAFYVEPKVGLELRWAYYELLRQDINSMDSGSAIPSTSREDFYNLPVLTPPLETQQHFSRLLTPCWTRQEENDRESRTLAALRDTLLPKLVSGDLRVKDGDRFLKETERC